MTRATHKEKRFTGWERPGGLESKSLPISKVPGFYHTGPWLKFHSWGS